MQMCVHYSTCAVYLYSYFAIIILDYIRIRCTGDSIVEEQIVRYNVIVNKQN